MRRRTGGLGYSTYSRTLSGALFNYVIHLISMEITELLAYWTARYDEEYEAEAETQDSLMDLAFDDLLEGLV